jgi:replication-associated recombination protein RarA
LTREVLIVGWDCKVITVIGLINIPDYNHYSSTIINSKIDNEYISKYKNFYNDGYIYDQDLEDGFSGQNYFPEGMSRRKFYYPVDRGFEREIKKRIEYFDKLRAEKQKQMKKEKTDA